MEIVFISIGIAVFILFICFLSGKNKPSNKRSSIEKIACSLFSIFRKNTNDLAHSIRTPKVLKEEALQEVEDALNALDESFKTGQCNLRGAKINLEKNVLPQLRDQPGMLESKARKAKKEYEESVKSNTPIEAYKQNAIKFLSYKSKALENIAKAEKNIQKIDIAIKTAKADYDGQKMDLEMIKSDLMAMTEVERYDLNQSISRIKSLQNELDSRMNEQEIQREVEAEMQDNSTTYSVDWEEAFNSL